MFQPPRIGLDALNRALLMGALVSGLLSLFFAYGTVPRLICTGLLAVCVLLAVFRLFSGNRERRYMENQRYLTFITGVQDFFRRLRGRGRAGQAQQATPRAERTRRHRARRARRNPTWNEIKHYKYLICPQCTQRLRVPRGKGRLLVTCTRCGNKFETRS